MTENFNMLPFLITTKLATVLLRIANLLFSLEQQKHLLNDSINFQQSILW